MDKFDVAIIIVLVVGVIGIWLAVVYNNNNYKECDEKGGILIRLNNKKVCIEDNFNLLD